MIKSKLTWETEFENEDELNNFIEEIGLIHSRRYGCIPVARDNLLKIGFYIGAVNRIKIEIEDTHS